jgi:uncharacterized protein YndB with AHSA1/START domain
MEAEVVVPAAPEAVFDYLARLDNHWRLMDGSVEVLSLDGDGEDGPDRAVVRLHGPLGLGRTAHTQVLDAERPRLLRGRASIGHLANGGRVTEGEVMWTLEPEGDDTRVHLSGSVRCAGLGDRAILALGGRAWMRARFRAALALLPDLVPQSAVAHTPDPQRQP